MRADVPGCPSCSSPLGAGQRYCLACGLPVVDVARALAPDPRPAPDPAPAAGPLRRRALPGGLRGAGAALAGALATGVLAGIAGSPATGAARRVVVAAPAAQRQPTAAPAGDLAALQATAPAAVPAPSEP